MYKKNKNIFLFFIIIFSIYCSLIIGVSWDELFHHELGLITLNYLLSLGKIYPEEKILLSEIYSPMYWTISAFFSKMLPSKFEVQVIHLINLTFSISTIFGISKISKELFNAKVGKIVFLLCFFYPIFFGHMSINGKDTILAFSNVWITYSILKYLKKQQISKKRNTCLFVIGFASALGTGIQMLFLGSLIPIILFVAIEIFFVKKIISKKFCVRKLLVDILKTFLIFYILLIIFWIDKHPNIFILPFKFFMEILSLNITPGLPIVLMNGHFYFTFDNPSKFYLLTNLFFKTPEFFLLLYFIFFFIIIKNNNFYIKKFDNFIYNLILILSILVFANLIVLIIPYPIYDGLRLFLWLIPYFCIVPGLAIYFLVSNLKNKKIKIVFIGVNILATFYLINFFLLTPYQYTYLNIFNGKPSNHSKKFENDYWGVSIKELIRKNNLQFKNNTKVAVCGANSEAIKKYFKKFKSINVNFVSYEESEYILMTNKVAYDNESISNLSKAKTCYDKFEGINISTVSRRGLVLSTIRKKL